MWTIKISILRLTFEIKAFCLNCAFYLRCRKFLYSISTARTKFGQKNDTGAGGWANCPDITIKFALYIRIWIFKYLTIVLNFFLFKLETAVICYSEQKKHRFQTLRDSKARYARCARYVYILSKIILCIYRYITKWLVLETLIST